MKLKNFIFILLVSLFLTQVAFSQTNFLKDIAFDVSIDNAKWKKKDKIIAKLSVQNNSGKKIRIKLSPAFYLIKEGVNENDLAAVGYYTYYSSAKMETTKDNGKTFVISDEDKIMFFPSLDLEKGEIKTVEMDLTGLAWGKSNSAFRPSGSWFSEIPKGNYKLYFAMRTGEKETFPYKDYEVVRDKKIESNRISVALLDGKEK